MLIYIALASLILSLTSIAIAVLLYRDVRYALNSLIDEFGLVLISRKRYRRVKRYILVKMVCRDGIDIRRFSEDLEKRIGGFLGPVVKMDCGLTLISFRPDLNRAIFRVVGSSMCVKYSLVALSLQHFVSEGCIIVPLRTSGLLSRIRKFVGYKR